MISPAIIYTGADTTGIRNARFVQSMMRWICRTKIRKVDELEKIIYCLRKLLMDAGR